MTLRQIFDGYGKPYKNQTNILCGEKSILKATVRVSFIISTVLQISYDW